MTKCAFLSAVNYLKSRTSKSQHNRHVVRLKHWIFPKANIMDKYKCLINSVFAIGTYELKKQSACTTQTMKTQIWSGKYIISSQRVPYEEKRYRQPVVFKLWLFKCNSRYFLRCTRYGVLKIIRQNI